MYGMSCGLKQGLGGENDRSTSSTSACGLESSPSLPATTRSWYGRVLWAREEVQKRASRSRALIFDSKLDCIGKSCLLASFVHVSCRSKALGRALPVALLIRQSVYTERAGTC